jgi:hypothetical protein
MMQAAAAKQVIVPVFMMVVFTVACNRTHRQSKGFMLDIAAAPEECGDSRNVVATAMGSHKAKLNAAEGLGMAEVAVGLREALKYRAEKLVYVKAEPDVSFADFMELVDTIRPEAEVISLITSEVEVLARERWCLAPSCGACTSLRSFGQGNR